MRDTPYHRILTGNRISIPASYLRKLDLKEGDIVMLEVKEGHLIVRPTIVVKK